MAQVVHGAASALTPVGSICGATVTGRDEQPIGSITELMIEGGSGYIAYAAVSVGGLLGVGERLFAVPWAAFTVDPVRGQFSLPMTRDELEKTAGFNKDAWPTGPDPNFMGTLATVTHVSQNSAKAGSADHFRSLAAGSP